MPVASFECLVLSFELMGKQKAESRIQNSGDRIQDKTGEQETGITGDQDSRESGGKEERNIEYRTRNVQCRSKDDFVPMGLSAFVAVGTFEKTKPIRRRRE